MSRVWYVFIGFIIGLGLMALGACGAATQPTERYEAPPTSAPSPVDTNDLKVSEIVLPDGRTVICVSDRFVGGVDCDWENAR